MTFRFAPFAALAACASMAATPLAAAELPRIATPASVETSAVFDSGAVNAQNYRRWHRRDRVDAGDVIGGILVLGTIAAVASAASKAGRNDRYRDRDYRYPDQRNGYRSRSYGSNWDDSRGIDRAVDMCADEVERNARVDTVDGAERNGDGWRVSGRLRTGEAFTCTIGNDGRINGVDYGRGFAPRGAAVDNQWSDDRYAAAREAQNGAGAAPAYPGGPLPGDAAAEPYETVDSRDFSG